MSVAIVRSYRPPRRMRCSVATSRNYLGLMADNADVQNMRAKGVVNEILMRAVAGSSVECELGDHRRLAPPYRAPKTICAAPNPAILNFPTCTTEPGHRAA